MAWEFVSQLYEAARGCINSFDPKGSVGCVMYAWGGLGDASET